MSKQKKRRIIRFSGTEVKHLFLGAVLTLAIGFSMPLFVNPYLYRELEVLTALAGMFACSFIGHELAHKLTAQHYGLWAEFRITIFGALITLLSIISPFKIISPGAVMIVGASDRKTIGKTSIAGPLFNIILALFFLVFLQVLQGNVALVFQWSLMINAFIAMFNLIPFGVLDGVKIFLWNKQIWALTFFAALLLAAYSFGYLQF
jgi:Zn-dependent protease